MDDNHKNGVDFFPLDVALNQKFELIEAEFGLKGFAVIVKLFQRIYGQEGYYCEWTDEVALLFARQCGLAGCNTASEIVSAAVRRGIFDQTLYRKYQILTSKGIQKRYLKAAARRIKVTVKGEYLLLSAAEIPKNVYIEAENADISAKNVDRNRQRKEEKSIVQNRTEKKKDSASRSFPSFSQSKHNAIFEDEWAKEIENAVGRIRRMKEEGIL